MKIISPKRLEALRKEFGFTQQEVSRLLGCDESYYSTIKNGYRKGSKKFYEGICKIYDTTIAREALIEYGYKYVYRGQGLDRYEKRANVLLIDKNSFVKYVSVEKQYDTPANVTFEEIELIKDRMEELRND